MDIYEYKRDGNGLWNVRRHSNCAVFELDLHQVNSKQSTMRWGRRTGRGRRCQTRTTPWRDTFINSVATELLNQSTHGHLVAICGVLYDVHDVVETIQYRRKTVTYYMRYFEQHQINILDSMLDDV